jgi:hypothetical protein
MSISSLGFDIFTTFAASLDTSTKATVAIENFVSQGYDLIVGTGAQFYVPIVNVWTIELQPVVGRQSQPILSFVIVLSSSPLYLGLCVLSVSKVCCDKRS